VFTNSCSWIVSSSCSSNVAGNTYWPAHPIWNSRGRKRADWRLPSGAYVECVGMMTDAQYARKITEKQRLAAELGLRLYLIGPTDMLQLDKLLVGELPQGLDRR